MEENHNEKNLIKYEEGIFSKIKNFFRKLFKKETVTILDNVNETKEETPNIQNSKNVNTFREDIIYNDINKELLDLQSKLENGEISEDDLTQNQIESLKKLYNEQIKDLKESIENYRRDIIAIQKRI